MFPDTKLVKIRRRNLGLTQLELAKEARVSQSLLAKLESGKIETSYSNMKRIFSALALLENSKSLKASELMTKKIFSVSEEEGVKKAALIMASKKVSQLPVFKDRACVGAITEKTISKKTAEGKDLGLAKVKEIMDEPFPVVATETPIKPIASLLNYSPAVLVSRKGKIVGVISKGDLLKAI